MYLFGLDQGRRHNKSDRKYGAYCREVTTHNSGSWGRSLWKVVTLLLGVGPWVSGNWQLGKEAGHKEGESKDRCCIRSCIYHHL